MEDHHSPGICGCKQLLEARQALAATLFGAAQALHELGVGGNFTIYSADICI
jgi:hypothetical protein